MKRGDFKLIFLLAAVLHWCGGEREVESYLPKTHPDCDKWAATDNECINNPRFMWSGCLGSCLQHSVDDDEKCVQWRIEGECTKNPNYVAVHCPESCLFSLAWNPWVRRSVGISDAPISAHEVELAKAEEPCGGIAVDAYSAGFMLHQRIRRFLRGQYQHVPGLSTSAPTEFNGLLGLAEACLYALRLYEVVINHASPSEEDRLRLNAGTIAGIQQVREVIGRGWSSDVIMQAVMDWSKLLDESDSIARALLSIQSESESDDEEDEHGKPFDFCRPSGTPTLELVARYFLVSNPSNYEDAEDLVGGPLDEEARTHGLTINPYKTLLNGEKMPVMGLGTWQLQGQQAIDAVFSAIRVGYRSIDTAQAYRNEAEVGIAVEQALAAGLVRSREELFIATKLSDPANAGYARTKELVYSQLNDLRTAYIDLYMLHSPIQDKQVQGDTWRALEELYDEGIIRALGVSNFDGNELKSLYETARVKPMVLQNKLDPYHVGKQLDTQGDRVIQYARERDILVVAYSTISAYPFMLSALDDPIIRYIAALHSFDQKQKLHEGTLETVGADGSIFDSVRAGAKHGITSPAQVLLRWALQKGFAVIPRSQDPGRLAANYGTLSMDGLTPMEMDMIDTLQLLISHPAAVPVTV